MIFIYIYIYIDRLAYKNNKKQSVIIIIMHQNVMGTLLSSPSFGQKTKDMQWSPWIHILANAGRCLYLFSPLFYLVEVDNNGP